MTSASAMRRTLCTVCAPVKGALIEHAPTSCNLLLEESMVEAWNFMQAVRPLCTPCSRQEPLCSKLIRPTITLFIDVVACHAHNSTLISAVSCY